MKTSPAIVIMAKAPRPGSVKTRLAPLLGAARCSELQEYLICQAVSLATLVAPTYVAFDPIDADGEMRQLVADEVAMFVQRGMNIGERMANAIEEVFALSNGPVLVSGTDVPTLKEHHLRAALAALDIGHDIVFGPAFDGGYYLTGLSKPIRGLFDIDPTLWSGPRVLEASIEAARRLGLSIATVQKLRDLDTTDDATAMLAEGDLSLELREILDPKPLSTVVGMTNASE
ncbi:MAG: glycosyltransferase [Actinomycetota bacterium]|nr:MAG: glycosyltransferase [Actinomycetota bacterium]